jgi:hypothetical protein
MNDGRLDLRVNGCDKRYDKARVPRLGEFSTVGRLFSLAIFLITEGNLNVLGYGNSTISGFGHILGDILRVARAGERTQDLFYFVNFLIPSLNRRATAAPHILGDFFHKLICRSPWSTRSCFQTNKTLCRQT